jgi:hypothetical protein
LNILRRKDENIGKSDDKTKATASGSISCEGGTGFHVMPVYVVV